MTIFRSEPLQIMKPTAHCSRKERKWVRQCDTNSICVDNHPRGAEWSDVELAACDGDIAAWGQLVEGLGFRVWDIFDIVARVLLPSNRLMETLHCHFPHLDIRRGGRMCAFKVARG